MAAEQKFQGGTERTAVETKIIWDDSNIRSAYANIADVVGSREEIMLLFRGDPAGYAEPRETRVKLNERIVFGPLAAERLAILVRKCIQVYSRNTGGWRRNLRRQEHRKRSHYKGDRT